MARLKHISSPDFGVFDEGSSVLGGEDEWNIEEDQDWSHILEAKARAIAAVDSKAL